MMSEDGDDAGSEEKMVVPLLSEKALLATGIQDRHPGQDQVHGAVHDEAEA